MMEKTGQQLTLQEYVNYSADSVRKAAGAGTLEGLRDIWTDRERRRRLLTDLQAASVYVDVLAEVLGQGDADPYDLLAHLAFAAPIRTRFLNSHRLPAREVILALVDKYRAAGIEEIADARVFRRPPFLEMGQAPDVVRRFGSTERRRSACARCSGGSTWNRAE